MLASTAAQSESHRQPFEAVATPDQVHPSATQRTPVDQPSRVPGNPSPLAQRQPTCEGPQNLL